MVLSPISGADRVADCWATECSSLPQPPLPLSASIRRNLAAAEAREPRRDWTATFRRVASSAFLTGSRSGFRASLLWAVKGENLAKLDAGQYDDAPFGVAPMANRTAALQDVAARVAAQAFSDQMREGIQ